MSSTALGITHNLEDYNADWPTGEEAAARLGVTRRTLDAWFSKGLLIRYRSKKTGKMTFHYSPEEIARLQEQVADGSLGHERMVLESPTSALLAQVYQQNRVLLQSQMQVQREALQDKQAVIEKLLTRCEDLERTHTELVKAREDALNTAHERQAVSETLTRDAARKDKIVTSLFELAPKALESRAASKFVSLITEEQLDIALAMGSEFWSEEQLAQMRALKKDKQAAAAREAAKKAKQAPQAAPQANPPEPPAAPAQPEPEPAVARKKRANRAKKGK